MHRDHNFSNKSSFGRPEEWPYPEPMTSSLPINDVSDLIGREAESEVLDAVIDQIHVRGGALIVRGEAGIGKSAFLRRARARVRAAVASCPPLASNWRPRSRLRDCTNSCIQSSA